MPLINVDDFGKSEAKISLFWELPSCLCDILWSQTDNDDVITNMLKNEDKKPQIKSVESVIVWNREVSVQGLKLSIGWQAIEF